MTQQQLEEAKQLGKGRYHVPVEYGPTSADVAHYKVTATDTAQAADKATKKHKKLFPYHSPMASHAAIEKLSEGEMVEEDLKPLTQYTYVPNRGHFVGGKKGDAAYGKHQAEYLKRKKITPVKEESEQLDEMAFDKPGVEYRSQSAKQMLDLAAAAKKAKKGVTMKEQFAPIGDVITLVANQQPGEATTILNDLLGARVSESLAARKQEVAQSLFAPSADALSEESDADKKFNAGVQKGMHIAGKEKLKDKAINKKFGHNVAKGIAIGKGLKEESEQLEEAKKKEKAAETVAQFLKRGGKITHARPHKAHGAPGPQKIKVPFRMGKSALREDSLEEGLASAAGYAFGKLMPKAAKKMVDAEAAKKTAYDADTQALLKRAREGKSAMREEAEQLDEMQTRKHFQAAADSIKSNPNLHERQILANHHAALFAAQNPRFDHARFHAAAGTNYQK